jgi:hypothetical protein
MLPLEDAGLLHSQYQALLEISETIILYRGLNDYRYAVAIASSSRSSAIAPGACE